jgi:exopolysaccharide production protein ExoQ
VREMAGGMGPSRWRMWGWGVLLAAIFFLATHDPLASLQWRQALPEEVRELVRVVSEGRMQRRLAFPLLALVGALALVRPGRLRFRPHHAMAWALAAFLGWQFLSIAWAAEPILTGKRLLVLAMLALGAAGFARQWTLPGLMGIVAVATALHLVLGVGTEVWLETFQPLEPGYRFAGTLHPNQQGINCALLALTALHFARSGSTRAARWAASAGLWSGLAFLFLTRSRTAAAAAVLALLLVYLLDAPPLRRAAAAAVACAAGALLFLLQANGVLRSSGALLLLGREDSSLSTLTGRTDIWGFALQRAAERPILGYGYNSFWSPRHTAEVSAVVDWKISEGHSAYLDTLLNLGVVGLLLFVAVLGVGLGGALSAHRRSREPALAVGAAILLFGALDGLLESAVVIPNLLSFVTLAILASLAAGGTHVGPAATTWRSVAAPTDRVAA